MARLKFLFRVLGSRLRGQSMECPYCGDSNSRLLQRKKLVLQLRQCPDCLLKFRYPKDEIPSAKEFYEHDYREGPKTELLSVDSVKQMMAANFAGTPMDLSSKVALLRSHLPGGRVLDYGCSWGYGVAQLAAAGFDATGFEISRPRSAFGRKHLGVRIMDDVAELGNLPAGHFDAIFTSHVLEHLPVLKPTLEAFGRLLRPGGVLLVFVPNAGGLQARELGTRWLALIGEKHTLALDAPFFSEALPRHGIKPRFTSAEYWTGAPYPIPPILLPEMPNCPTALDGDELVVLGSRD
ncbi:MAG: class I SAM-dependent methyltransferase [Limisphaerales bacterium]